MSRLALPGSTGPRSSVSGPHAQSLLIVASSVCFVSGLTSENQSRRGPGPEAQRLPFPCVLMGLPYQAFRLIGGLGVLSNSSLQRTRLRSPLNSISLGNAC